MSGAVLFAGVGAAVSSAMTTTLTCSIWSPRAKKWRKKHFFSNAEVRSFFTLSSVSTFDRFPFQLND
jgi:hypothetical protein